MSTEKKCSEIVNGIPITRHYDWYNKKTIIDSELLTDLPEQVQEAVLDWIRRNVSPRKTLNKRHTSYGIKHCLQRDLGIYTTNNQFKHAMLLCGYMPENEPELNWIYRISEKSLCFRTEVCL